MRSKFFSGASNHSAAASNSRCPDVFKTELWVMRSGGTSMAKTAPQNGPGETRFLIRREGLTPTELFHIDHVFHSFDVFVLVVHVLFSFFTDSESGHTMQQSPNQHFFNMFLFFNQPEDARGTLCPTWLFMHWNLLYILTNILRCIPMPLFEALDLTDLTKAHVSAARKCSSHKPCARQSKCSFAWLHLV